MIEAHRDSRMFELKGSPHFVDFMACDACVTYSFVTPLFEM
jgi:hypothetical protein